MFYVYVLWSLKRPWTYTGSTGKWPARFFQHNQGRVFSAKPYAPFEVLLFETYSSLELAVERERYLKTTSGRRELKYIVRQYLNGRLKGESASPIEPMAR